MVTLVPFKRYLDSFSARVPNREHLTNTGASTYSPSAFLRFSLTATVNPATARPLAVARISTSRVRLPSMMTRLIAMPESNLLGYDYLPFGTTNIANYNASIVET